MAQIPDHKGNPVQTQKLTRELAAPALAGIRSVWNEQVTGGLTPARLASLLQGAAEGDIRDYLTLAEEMEERDLHYRCEMGKRRLAVTALPVTVEAASDSTEDVKLADAIRNLVKRPGFRSLLKDLLDGLGKGYAVCEIMWQRGAAWIPRSYEWRDPRFFTFDRTSLQQLRLLDPADMVEGIELAAYKYIVHLPHLKTGIPIRGGIARVAAWAYLFKNYTVKDWMAFAEVFGMPLRLGKYQAGATEADINILKMAVANLGSDAAAVVPDSMLIDFVESSKTTGGDTLFMRMADWLDAQISRGILGQTATTQGTPGKLGGDEAQSEVREDIRNDDAAQLAETLNRDLVRPYIDLNFGVQQNYPELILRVVENEDLTVLTTALKELVPLGLEVEQSVIRDKLGLPEPAKGAKLLGAAVQEVPPAQDKTLQDKQDKQDKAQNSEQTAAAPEVEQLLYDYARAQSDTAASVLIDQAEKILGEVDSLEAFRERLIDLFRASNPELLAEVFARLDMMSRMVGRAEVADE